VSRSGLGIVRKTPLKGQLEEKTCEIITLKGQSHEKVGEKRIWGDGLGPN
jgi:hypothetical protein